MYKPLLVSAALLLGNAIFDANAVRAQDYDTGTAPNSYEQRPYSSNTYPNAAANGTYDQQYDQNSYPSDQERYGSNQGQGYRQAHPQAPLPREAIEDMLRRQHFGEFRNFENKGNIYKVTALDQRGQLYRLSIDAYTGRIIEAKPKES
jgi:uncharacterized membrane protein YkoI